MRCTPHHLSDVTKFLHSGDRFREPPFLFTENGGLVGLSAKLEGKKMFKFHRLSVNGPSKHRFLHSEWRVQNRRFVFSGRTFQTRSVVRVPHTVNNKNAQPRRMLISSDYAMITLLLYCITPVIKVAGSTLKERPRGSQTLNLLTPVS